MNGLSRYYQEKSADRLFELFDRATPDQIVRGVNWYERFNRLMGKIAKRNGYTKTETSAVFSALSPRNKLDKNVIDTETVLKAHKKGLKPSDIKVSTFHTNKRKAFDILEGLEEIEPSAMKTHSFFMNVAYLSDQHVTIDSWHLKACLGEYYKGSLTGLRYRQLADITRDTAKELGLTGYQLQAVVWNVIREAEMTEAEIKKEAKEIDEITELA